MSDTHRCPTCGSFTGPQLRVGDTLYGYCGGAFGRDSYEDKTVLHIGHDYVVVRSDILRGAYPNYTPDTETAVYQGDPNDLVEYTKPPPPDHY